jgi:hypothetical protein
MRPPKGDAPRKGARRRRLLAIAASVGVHGLLLAALLPVVADAPDVEPQPPVVVALTRPEPPVAPPAPTPGAAPGGGAPAEKADKPTPPKAPEPAAPLPAPKPVPAPVRHRPARTPPPSVPTVIAAAAPASTVGLIAVVGEAQLAGALTAGSGQGAGPGDGSGTGSGDGSGPGRGTGSGRCDMVERLQTVLRRDANIRAVAASAHSSLSGGRGALLVWNGDWLRNPGQEGKGLAGLRQAIAVEVAFAPAACRNQTVDGLVLIRLGDAPGDPRLALGAGRWRWSDLLGL